MQKNIRCMNCPFRCSIEVEYEDDILLSIDGNSCHRGEKYIEDTLKIQKKFFVGYLNIINSKAKKIKVSSTKPILLEQRNQILEKIATLEVSAPIKIHDLLVSNIIEGVDLQAEENMA